MSNKGAIEESLRTHNSVCTHNSVRAQWRELDHALLPTLADQWSIVNFFLAVPWHLQGSVLLALTRKRALVIELSNGLRVVLLKLYTAAVRLHQYGKEHYHIGQSMEHSDSYLLAFAPSAQAENLLAEQFAKPQTYDERLKAQKRERVLNAASARTDYQWQLPAGTMQLRADYRWFVLDIASSTEHAMRVAPVFARGSWTWAWRGSVGPVYLWIYVDRSKQQIRDWLRSLDVFGFQCIDDEGSHWLYIFPNPDKDTAYRFDTHIKAHNGCLEFSRGIGYIAGTCFDAIYLHKVAAGELGELSFDVFDGDYVALNAVGYSCASLAAYLNQSARRYRVGKSKHRWNDLSELVVIVPPGADIEASVREQFNRKVGAQTKQKLRDTLSHTPIALLPRYVNIVLPWGMSPPQPNTPLFERIGGGFHDRIHWRWSNLPKPVDSVDQNTSQGAQSALDENT